MTFAYLGGLFLGPILGAFTGATACCRDFSLRAARAYALSGAFLGGALPLFIVLTSPGDSDYKNEPNGASLMMISVSLPLIWALGLLLFALFTRPRALPKADESAASDSSLRR